jgi:RHS repeat-associated protein
MVPDSARRLGDNPENDYIWLGGRPVAMIRGQLTAGTWARQWDGTPSPNCGRNDDVGACGVYFVVTDPIGKPVAMLDASQNFTGFGEYDPFGAINRMYVDQETPHPVIEQPDGGAWFGTYAQSDGWGSGYSIEIRPRILVFDGTSDGGLGSYDNEGAVFKIPDGGHANLTVGEEVEGGLVLPWLESNEGTVGFFGGQTDAGIWGAVVDWWEYRRYTTAAAAPLFTPIRFPGQYHDDETDLNQNHNRFYDASHGVYWEPDPVYTTSPEYVGLAAAQSLVMPVYGYAGDNPVNNTDRSGRLIDDLINLAWGYALGNPTEALGVEYGVLNWATGGQLGFHYYPYSQGGLGYAVTVAGGWPQSLFGGNAVTVGHVSTYPTCNPDSAWEQHETAHTVQYEALKSVGLGSLYLPLGLPGALPAPAGNYAPLEMGPRDYGAPSGPHPWPWRP